MGGFLWGVSRKLIKRITEIEIDTHYYDNDVVPSSQTIFTYDINRTDKTAEITGFVSNNISQVVIPYRIQYGDSASHMFANVITLKNGAFKENVYLNDMTIPNTIDIIPKDCFKNCSHLIRVNIPKSIKVISSGAFQGCTDLKSLFIPYTVNEIQADAFKDCSNLKIICYKHSTAEEYAKANNVPYSLISYTLDDDITKDSENLVTSGTIWTNIQAVIKKITDHINNKSNPHDNSTFKNSNMTGSTNINSAVINGGTLTTVANNDLSLVNKQYVDKEVSEITSPSVGIGYQKQYDTALQTNTKTVVGAINELNNKVNTVSGKLQTGWNNVSLNVLYPLGWTFLNKPYAYTDDGVSVDYRVKNLDVSNETIKNNTNTFDIYVPCDCNYMFSTTNSNSISGYPIDYLVVSYYYTGADGKNLDTVTGISNTNWPLSKNTVGYSHGNEIKNSSGTTLIYWGGDNTGGGSANASTKYYESVYFNIKAIQEQLPNEDIDIILYGTWFSELGNGNIYISMNCYTCSTTPAISTNNKIITLSGDDLTETYSNDNDLSCYIPTKKGSPADYKNAYTPAFKITFKKVTDDSNYRTIIIQPLS